MICSSAVSWLAGRDARLYRGAENLLKPYAKNKQERRDNIMEKDERIIEGFRVNPAY